MQTPLLVLCALGTLQALNIGRPPELSLRKVELGPARFSPGGRLLTPFGSQVQRARASYVAANDYALGRIVKRLSKTSEWRHMAIFITADAVQGGVDHVDSHRAVFTVAGPYAVSHSYDATATGLSECFTAKPDFTPYTPVPENPEIFDQANAREPLDLNRAPKLTSPGDAKAAPANSYIVLRYNIRCGDSRKAIRSLGRIPSPDPQIPAFQ